MAATRDEVNDAEMRFTAPAGINSDDFFNLIPWNRDNIDCPNTVPDNKANRGRVLHSRARDMVIRLHDEVTKKKRDLSMNNNRKCQMEVCQEVCTTLNISMSTYYRIMKENKTAKATGEKIRTPGRKRPRESIADRVDDFDKDAIRRKIRQLYAECKYPTVDILHKYAVDELKFSGGKTTFTMFMKTQLGFQYKQVNGRPFFMERGDVRLARCHFLERYKEYTQAKRNLIFLDETWVWQRHTLTKCWQSESCHGMKVPSGKGKRLILLHAGGNEGFIKDCLLHFVSRSGHADYHRDMDAQVFTKWFKEKLLVNIPPNSVIVMDNASYHSVRLEKCPTMSTKKAEMVSWLQSRNVKDATSKMFKIQLYALVKKHKPSCIRYAIDEMAKQAGHEVLRLPPYHCHYNPIELIWAQVKGNVAVNNSTFKIADVERLTVNAINSVTAHDWQNCIKHTDTICSKDINSEGLMEEHVTQLLIKLGMNSDSDSTSDSEGDGF